MNILTLNILEMIKKSIIFFIIAISVLTVLAFSCKNDVDNNLGPIITKYPTDLTVFLGDKIDTNCFSIEAKDPNGDHLTYQWYKFLGDDLENQGSAIPGQTKPFFIPNKSVADTFLYFVTVSDGQIEPATDVVKLIVIDSTKTRLR